MGQDMIIALVGGLDRNESRYVKIASGSGHKLESHTGRTGGRASEELRRLIDRASLVIIQITINSHGGVQLAKRIAKKNKKPAVLIPRLGQEGFRKLLEKVNREPEKFSL